jgi:hypothetical protein
MFECAFDLFLFLSYLVGVGGQVCYNFWLLIFLSAVYRNFNFASWAMNLYSLRYTFLSFHEHACLVSAVTYNSWSELSSTLALLSSTLAIILKYFGHYCDFGLLDQSCPQLHIPYG